jgi:hypothetical protein
MTIATTEKTAMRPFGRLALLGWPASQPINEEKVPIAAMLLDEQEKIAAAAVSEGRASAGKIPSK